MSRIFGGLTNPSSGRDAVARAGVHRTLAVLIVSLVAADWASKLWITNRLALGDTLSLVDGWFYLMHRHNPGVAFSLMANLPDTIRVPLLTGLALIGIVLFGRMLVSTPDRPTQLGAATVIAGAFGNMGERVVSGGVTDFLFFAYFPFVFNVADAAITMGGSLLAVRLFQGHAVPASAEPAGPNPV